MKRKFESAVEFKHHDPYMTRFVVPAIKGIKAMGPIILEPGVFPADYENELYEVEADIVFNVAVKSKGKPKK